MVVYIFVSGPENSLATMRTLRPPIAEGEDTLVFASSEAEIFSEFLQKFKDCTLTMVYEKGTEWKMVSWNPKARPIDPVIRCSFPRRRGTLTECPLERGIILVTPSGPTVTNEISDLLLATVTGVVEMITNGDIDPRLRQLVQLWKAGKTEKFKAAAWALVHSVP